MPPAPHALFVPGRLCLAGEHSDWAAEYRLHTDAIAPGAALVVTLQQGLHATAAPHPTHLNLDSALAGPLSLPVSALRPAARTDSLWRYACAAAHLMSTRFRPCERRGLSLSITRATLPPARGFSSSAAVCVLVARAYDAVYGLRLAPPAVMDLAYAAERLTGSACGRLDQVVAFGPAAVLSVCFDGDGVEVARVADPPRPLHLVVADLARGKDTPAILSALHAAYPATPGEQAGRLRDALGASNLRVIERMTRAISDADASALARAMVDAQTAFDAAARPLCPAQLTAPALHAAMDDAEFGALALGGKGVGSQGDGAVQWVARDLESAERLAALATKRFGAPAHVVTLGGGAAPAATAEQDESTNTAATDAVTAAVPRGPAPAPGAVRTAVIPVAGLGTRLFPASHAIRPKAFFPIVDTDGRAKPVLLHLVEAAAAAGVDEVVVVASDDTAAAVRALFAPQDALVARLKPEMAAYAARLRALAACVSVRLQEKPLGFGHAVACGAPTDRPFLLLLGDVVFRARDGAAPVVSQVVDAFAADGGATSAVGVTQCDSAEAGCYGVVDAPAGRVAAMRRVVEKPCAAEIDRLQRDGRCDIVLGPYVFTPALMVRLGEDVRLDRRDRGEIQLTGAMAAVCESEGMRAVRFDGEAFDTGNPVEYVRTVARMAA